MMNTIDKQLMRQVKALARRECANYQDGICLPEDRPCHVLHPVYTKIHDGAIDCDWFLEAVMPLDQELTKAVWQEILREEGSSGESLKECVCCHKPFLPASNRQRYCEACGETVKKARVREKQRRYRQRQKSIA